MRQYDDPVEVRRSEAQDPDQFLWRGRLWKVRAVVAHWVEAGPRWLAEASWGTPEAAFDQASDQALDQASDQAARRELWRVEAGRGAPAVRPASDPAAPATHGVFDLSFDGSDGRWQLVGCLD